MCARVVECASLCMCCSCVPLTVEKEKEKMCFSKDLTKTREETRFESETPFYSFNICDFSVCMSVCACVYVYPVE